MPLRAHVMTRVESRDCSLLVRSQFVSNLDPALASPPPPATPVEVDRITFIYTLYLHSSIPLSSLFLSTYIALTLQSSCAPYSGYIRSSPSSQPLSRAAAALALHLHVPEPFNRPSRGWPSRRPCSNCKYLVRVIEGM